jgi:hypothetical protein
MKYSLGLAVGSTEVRAVALRGTHLIAAEVAELAPDDDLASVVASILSAAPLPPMRRRRVVVALGPSLAQTRRISGLPTSVDPRILAQVIRENPGRFFLRTATAPMTTGVRPVAPGVAWAAALDTDTVRAVDAGCRQAGYLIDAVVPAVAVLGAGLQASRLVWRDGTVATEVLLQDGAMVEVRRFAAGVAVPELPVPQAVPALAEAGDGFWKYADAYGAALLPATELLALRVGALREHSVPAWRIAVPSTLLAVAIAAGLVLPGLRAMRTAEDAAAQLALMGRERVESERVKRELGEVTSAVGEIAAFARRGYSPTLLMEDLTRALPAGTSLVAVRIDSAGGSLVALTTRAASFIAPMERVPGVAAPEIVGPVTREVAAGRPVERVSVRFQLDAGARRVEPRVRRP